MEALRINESVDNKPAVEASTADTNVSVTYKNLPVSIEEVGTHFARELDQLDFSTEEKERQFDRKLDQIHRRASRATKKHMARTLKELLSTRLTAYIIGQSERTINRWAHEEGGIIERMLSINTMRKLITLYEIVLLIDDFEGQEAAKTWLLGMNPQLDDLMPAEAIRNGQLREAIVAARSFVAGN